MDLLLHIGMPKTGTTALQAWLMENALVLAANGIGLSPGLGQPQNAKLSLACMDPDQEPARFHQTTVAERDAGFGAVRAEVEAALQADTDRAHAAARRMTVISDENCAHLDTAARVERVHALLSPRFDEIRILVWVRPQVEVCLSNASNQTRIGRRVDRSLFDIGPDTPLFDYDRLLSAWETVFGAATISVLPYKRIRDVAGHVTGLLGLDPALPRPAPRLNTAVGVGAMALVNQFAGTDMFTHALFRGQSLALNNMLGRAGENRPLRIGRRFAAEIQARFADSNARLIGRHGGLEAKDLDLDLEVFDDDDDFDLLETPAPYANDLKALVEGLYLEGQIERLRGVLLTAEMALHLSGRVRLNMRAQDPGAITAYAAQAGLLVEFIRAKAPGDPRLAELQARLGNLERVLGS